MEKLYMFLSTARSRYMLVCHFLFVVNSVASAILSTHSLTHHMGRHCFQLDLWVCVIMLSSHLGASLHTQHFTVPHATSSPSTERTSTAQWTQEPEGGNASVPVACSSMVSKQLCGESDLPGWEWADPNCAGLLPDLHHHSPHWPQPPCLPTGETGVWI